MSLENLDSELLRAWFLPAAAPFLSAAPQQTAATTASSVEQTVPAGSGFPSPLHPPISPGHLTSLAPPRHHHPKAHFPDKGELAWGSRRGRQGLPQGAWPQASIPLTDFGPYWGGGLGTPRPAISGER